MLSGEMGNHTMSYHGWPLLAELLRTGRWWRLLGEIASSGYRWRHMIRHRTIAPFVPAPLFRRYKQWRRGGRPPWHDFSAIHPEFAARSGVVDRAAREYLPFDAPPPRDGRLHRISWGSIATARRLTGLRRCEPTSASIFGRRPLIGDWSSSASGFHKDQYLRKGRDRWLIRRAMQGRLPEVVLANRKRGHSRLTGSRG